MIYYGHYDTRYFGITKRRKYLSVRNVIDELTTPQAGGELGVGTMKETVRV